MRSEAEKIQRAMRRAQAAGDQAAVEDLRERLTAAYQSEVGSPTDEMSGLQRFQAGIGQGMSNVARRAGNLVGLASDEDVARAKEIDAALLATRGGKVGSFVGEAAATAPLGGVGGAGARVALGRLATTGVGRALGANALRRGLATTAGYGAAQGAGAGALLADPGERLKEAGIGAAAGAVLPWAGGHAWRGLTRGLARPTQAARALLRRNVDLTPGQMNPDSAIGQLEEAFTNWPVIGPMIQRAREASMRDWQTAARRQGVAPGGSAQSAERGLNAMFPEYQSAYAPSKGVQMEPRLPGQQGMPRGAAGPPQQVPAGGAPLADFPNRPGALSSAAQNPAHLATTSTREAAQSWLQNLASMLPGQGRGVRAGGRYTVSSDQLLSMRSDLRDRIREEVRKREQADTGLIEILEQAEGMMTQSIESQLSPQARQALQAADRQYAQYKILENATHRAGDARGGFTPYQLGEEVRRATSKGPYTRGAGGPLRELARHGRQVFDQRVPQTGARLIPSLGVAALIKAAPLAAIPILGATTTRVGRTALAGNTALQRRAHDVARALRRRGVRGGELGTAYGGPGGKSAYEYQKLDDEED